MYNLDEYHINQNINRTPATEMFVIWKTIGESIYFMCKHKIKNEYNAASSTYNQSLIFETKEEAEQYLEKQKEWAENNPEWISTFKISKLKQLI